MVWLRLREESAEEAGPPIFPIPGAAILGDGLNLGTAALNSSLKLARNEQANSTLRSTRLQGALLGTCQSRSVLLLTMASATFDAIRSLSVFRWGHTGERCVDRREDDGLYIFSGPL